MTATARNVRPIYPLHPTMRANLAKGARLRPLGMSHFSVLPEQHDVMQRIAIDIFTDMTNAGAPLQDTLVAIYLSGLHHGSVLTDKLNEANNERSTVL